MRCYFMKLHFLYIAGYKVSFAFMIKYYSSQLSDWNTQDILASVLVLPGGVTCFDVIQLSHVTVLFPLSWRHQKNLRTEAAMEMLFALLERACYSAKHKFDLLLPTLDFVFISLHSLLKR